MPVKEHQIHMQPYPVMSHTLLYDFMTLKLKTKTTINSEEKKTFSLNIITSLTILHISHLAGDILMSLLLLNVVYMHACTCDISDQNQNVGLMQNNGEID